MKNQHDLEGEKAQLCFVYISAPEAGSLLAEHLTVILISFGQRKKHIPDDFRHAQKLDGDLSTALPHFVAISRRVAHSTKGFPAHYSSIHWMSLKRVLVVLSLLLEK